MSDVSGRKRIVFNSNSKGNLASEVSNWKVIICYSNLNTNQANLASEASEQKVFVFHRTLNANQANLDSEAEEMERDSCLFNF